MRQQHDRTLRAHIMKCPTLQGGERMTAYDVHSWLRSAGYEDRTSAVATELGRMADLGLVRVAKHPRTGHLLFYTPSRTPLKLRMRPDSEIGVEWPVRTATLPGWR